MTTYCPLLIWQLKRVPANREGDPGLPELEVGLAGSVLTITSPSEAGLLFVGVEAGDWEI
jgi:hypothetical protein